ncbi:GNAT family N-acetyltransferase [Pararhizobium haloflavum]|uniref:GNAT family N-acetyltransferase n=1 Tax=Pararhizobium haloflavum TaxID=2037914 RepID=UPI000C17FAC7|nr:GNAT family N-acetyltransferase [Pararhizobium haloflavum]
MVSDRIFETGYSSQANALVGELADEPDMRTPPDTEMAVGRPGRSLTLYPGRAGYELQDELDFLANRVMEPNVFFTGRFLAPAMPRLEDRQVRLLLMRDEDARRSRMRFLMPFSIEKPGFAVGPSVMRVWTHPFGPLGTPLVDAEGAAETLDNLLEALSRPESGLPGVLVLPDMRIEGPVTELLRAVAISRGLPLTFTEALSRPMLASEADGETYLKASISRHHFNEMARQRRRLEERGRLSYEVARQPRAVAAGLEAFLALEASGWKGRRKSAMTHDRLRAAFAREAVANLAATDNVRIHTLTLDHKPIAAIVVFVISGEAYTWKTAYDEDFAAYSPGKLLFARLTEQHLDDANIERTDSCAVPDHPIASRLWRERGGIATMVIGLTPERDRDMRQVARGLHLYRNTRNLARILRGKIRAVARRKAARRLS